MGVLVSKVSPGQTADWGAEGGTRTRQGALSDKKSARIMAISGPEGSHRMVTFRSGWIDLTNLRLKFETRSFGFHSPSPKRPIPPGK